MPDFLSYGLIFTDLAIQPGDFEQGGIEQWCRDIVMAVDEIRAQATVENVCLAGLRLGGTLSLLSGIESGKIDSIVLWDPVYQREIL